MKKLVDLSKMLQFYICLHVFTGSIKTAFTANFVKIFRLPMQTRVKSCLQEIRLNLSSKRNYGEHLH